MNANIRIIKQSERNRTGQKRAAESRHPEAKNARQATRDITGHVSTWIKEFQQRHTPDPRRAFANLFVDSATAPAD